MDRVAFAGCYMTTKSRQLRMFVACLSAACWEARYRCPPHQAQRCSAGAKTEIPCQHPPSPCDCYPTISFPLRYLAHFTGWLSLLQEVDRIIARKETGSEALAETNASLLDTAGFLNANHIWDNLSEMPTSRGPELLRTRLALSSLPVA
jgi:hypothetical protein